MNKGNQHKIPGPKTGSDAVSSDDPGPYAEILAQANANMRALMGEGNLGYDCDEIPGGYGPFGYVATNPIPTLGIEGTNTYLEQLRTKEGHPLKWIRSDIYETPNIDNLIDSYEISDAISGHACGTLYISPFHKRSSRKTPEGFYLKTK